MSRQRQKDNRVTLFENDRMVIRGLCSATISEAAVALKTHTGDVVKVHALELYKKLENGRVPLLAVDILANCYLRQTYLSSDTQSATLGTSSVAAFSFRTSDKALHYLPDIESAEALLWNKLKVRVLGRYGRRANFQSERIYSPDDFSSEVSTTFEAHEEIQLCRSAIGKDAFRLFTVTSMFYDETRFDADLLVITDRDNVAHEFKVNNLSPRDQYLITASMNGVRKLEVVKRPGSTARRGTPGSRDSPSIVVEVIGEEWIPQLSAQAYLSSSNSVNDDSLSVWLEWRKAPEIIQAGERYSVKFKVTACGEA